MTLHTNQYVVRELVRSIFSICHFLAWTILIFGSLTSTAFASEPRIALVIGNADYQGMKPLANPLNDAADIATKLRGLGFEVVYRENLRLDQTGTALQEFEDKLTSESVALVYYAGHGIQVDGENYLPLVDANIRNEHDVRSQSLSLKQLAAPLERRGTRLNLLFLDACRDNPYSYVGQHRGAAPAGLARYEGTRGSLVVYATGPGQTAEDGKGRNGPFSLALLEMIDTPDLEVNVMLTRVTAAVKARTEGKQVPYHTGNLQAEFFFHLTTPAAPLPLPREAANNPPDPDAELWKEVSQSNRPEDYDLYLGAYPQGRYVPVAKLRMARLKQEAAPAKKPETAPEWTTDRALGLLKDLAATKPTGKMGQAEALRFLTSQGYSAAGMDLSGLDLSGSSLASLNAEDSLMSMAVLTGSDLTRSHLARTRLVAARGDGADFSDADLSGARVGFGQFSEARFHRANLKNSNWPLANLRNASFKDADLTGANFEFADLRGADFSGARLEHAFLGGADLRGAKFDEANFSNTDIVAALYEPDSVFARDNLGLCETVPGTNSINLRGIELIPNTKWDGGYEHKTVREKRLELPKGMASWYDSCVNRLGSVWDSRSVYAPVGKYFISPKEYFIPNTEFTFDHALLKTGGRREALTQFLIRAEDELKTRLKLLPSPNVLPRRVQTLAGKLSMAAGKVDLSAPIRVDGDSALLYLLKYSPEEADTLNWPYIVRARYDLEVEARTHKATYPDHKANYPESWGDFFPESAYQEDIYAKPVMAEFRRWTMNRVAKLPPQATITVGAHYEDGTFAWGESKQPTVLNRFGSGSQNSLGDYTPMLKELGMPTDHAMLIPTTMAGHTGLLVFDKPTKDLKLPENPPVTGNSGLVEVTLEIKKVQLHKEYVIWMAAPLSARVVNSE